MSTNTPPPSRLAARPTIAVVLGISVVWLLIFVWGMRNQALYVPLGIYAAGICLFGATQHAAAWRRASTHFALRPRARDVAVGVVVGALTLVATHLAFALLTSTFAFVRADVERLYLVAAITPQALLAVVLVIVAEEVLWRRLLLDALRAVVPTPLAIVLATTVYATAQLGVGSWLLAVAAFVLGALYCVLTTWTGRLHAALCAHAVWTLGVLGFWRLL